MSKTPKLNYRYFAGWKVVGRYVRRGEKSRKRDKDGRPVFHIDQTEILKAALLLSPRRTWVSDRFAYRNYEGDAFI